MGTSMQGDQGTMQHVMQTIMLAQQPSVSNDQRLAASQLYVTVTAQFQALA